MAFGSGECGSTSAAATPATATMPTPTAAPSSGVRAGARISVSPRLGAGVVTAFRVSIFNYDIVEPILLSRGDTDLFFQPTETGIGIDHNDRIYRQTKLR